MKKPTTPLGSFLRFFGSIKLAMLLLIVIIVASVVGTFVEARFDASVAQAYIYDSPWFIAWLLLLCVNLVGAVLVRYPWKPHQIGFIITHGGMVVILIGGIIGRIWGVEGNVTLVAGERPQNFMVINQALLQVQQPGEKTASFPLRLDLRRPNSDRPANFRKGDLRVTVLEVADELGVRQAVEATSGYGPPALRLVMTGDGMPHPIDQWLVRDHRERGRLVLGSDVVRFATKGGVEAPIDHSREVHFAFSKIEGMNLSRLLSGSASGAEARFRFSPSEAGSTDQGVLELRVAGEDFVFPVQESLARLIPLGGTEWTLRVLEYLPDFRMEGGTPVNVSDDPNNPAVVFELTGPVVESTGDACCPPETGDHGHTHSHGNVIAHADGNYGNGGGLPAGHPTRLDVKGEVVEDACCPTDGSEKKGTVTAGHSGQLELGTLTLADAGADAENDACCPTEIAGNGVSASTASTHPSGHPHSHGPTSANGGSSDGNELIIRYDEEERLVFESRTPDGERTGVIEVGEDFSPGWAGWSFRVEEFMERSAVREEIGPMAAAGMRRLGASGLRLRLDKNGSTVEQWVQMGAMTIMPLGDERIHAAFGYRLQPLDFTLELERFEVEFNPGTQTPASFKSYVTFTSADGEKLTRPIWMNNPTNFPNFMGAGLLGTSYKFSQSSWNPGNHDQTTLQVIRDPGWSLKWIGSLLFCVGLVTVFYLKPYPRFQRNNGGDSGFESEAEPDTKAAAGSGVKGETEAGIEPEPEDGSRQRDLVFK